MARRRTLRDLLSVGGIVGCVALGVAVIVAPATSNLRSIVPEGAPITAPDIAPRVGDVAVEVRPGAAQRRAAATSLLPAELVLAPPALVDRVAGLTSVRSALSPALLASSTQPALLEVATPLPVEPAPAPVAVAPVVVAPAEALTVQSVEPTRPGKGKGKAAGCASSPASKRKPSGQVQTTSSMQAASSGVSSEDGGTRGQGPKADSDRPRDQHPGRAPEHAAAHQRR